jgi:23S rRNA-/tRNA-specific pseudouridylate synthase
MTAATARTATSGKAKSTLSASSKAAAQQSAAAETIAAQTESSNETESADEHSEVVAIQPESIAEEAEPAAAPEPSVTAEPESVSKPAKVATMTPKTDASESNTDAASPQTSPEPKDSREENLRFRIFVIDSGWNHPASKVLQDNFELIHALTDEDPIYVLDRDKSIALLRKNKGLIGHDPIIAVHDVTASGLRKHLGFRLHLGLQENEKECLSSLKMFARFINTHRDSKDLEADCRRKLHKQGMAGAIEIVGGAAHTVLMEG